MEAKDEAMAVADEVNWLMTVLRDTTIELVREDGRDLSARQLGVLLVCYLERGPHTVRGLAVRLNTAKFNICRAIDRLVLSDLAFRGGDPRDRRSILVTRTAAGTAYIVSLRELMRAAARRNAIGTGSVDDHSCTRSPARSP